MVISQLRFSKMHGIGNDFVVIDGVRQTVHLNVDTVRWLADRRFGVGCDQVLLVESATRPDVDFRYRIFNADGGEVEQCGNGARCFARFVHGQNLTDRNPLRVETKSGDIILKLENDGLVTVNMGAPRLLPEQVPFVANQRAITYELELADTIIHISTLSMGNPHAVLIIDDITNAPIAIIGPLIHDHQRFPQRVNVGFMQVINNKHIKLRVYERGAGETLACGTGACAAVVAGRIQGLLSENVMVDLPGGQLAIRWKGDGESVWMSGPAVHVYDGVIDISQQPQRSEDYVHIFRP